jgi:hypothetical protein
LLIPKRLSARASITLLALALVLAFWPRDIGPFGPSLAAEWGSGQIANFWALLSENSLSILAGILLVAKKI